MITTDNKTIEGWFTANERSNYRASIDAAKLLELDNISFYVGTTAITIPTLLAERFLALIQLYADQCFMVTK